MAEAPKLLRVPERFESIEAVFACALKMNLTNVLVLSQRENGNIVFLESPGLTACEANWLIDQAKRIFLGEEPRYVSLERGA